MTSGTLITDNVVSRMIINENKSNITANSVLFNSSNGITISGYVVTCGSIINNGGLTISGQTTAGGLINTYGSIQTKGLYISGTLNTSILTSNSSITTTNGVKTNGPITLSTYVSPSSEQLGYNMSGTAIPSSDISMGSKSTVAQPVFSFTPPRGGTYIVNANLAFSLNNANDTTISGIFQINVGVSKNSGSIPIPGTMSTSSMIFSEVLSLGPCTIGTLPLIHLPITTVLQPTTTNDTYYINIYPTLYYGESETSYMTYHKSLSQSFLTRIA
jgi:hypothetical protein